MTLLQKTTGPCSRPWAEHPEHGPCTTHVGWMHTTKTADGRLVGWPDRELTVGNKRRGT